MSGTVKTLLIVAAAAVLLFLFRVSVCTIYTIPDNTLAPAVKQGDRVLVNRWSYGSATGLLFAFTYLYTAINTIFDLDQRLYGWFSLFVAINSIPAGLLCMTSGYGCQCK